MPQLKIQDYMEDFKDCLQYEKPYCQPECPFHLDVNDFIEKMQKGNYNSAFKTYRNAVGFPAIVSRICSQPCQNVCPMKDHGGAIELKNLERAATEHAKRTDPTGYNIPVRPGKVAIIGSGLAGLGALLRMATKKYETHIFEKSDCLGGKLNNHEDASIFMADIEKQLHHEKYEVHLNTEITSIEELDDMGFDVVFVATGKGGADFGLLETQGDADEKYVLTDENSHGQITSWFGGGALIGDEDIYALAGGLYMGLVLEACLKTGNPTYPKDNMKTNTIVDSRLINDQKATKPASQFYSQEESLSEAQRCLQCQCKFCKTYEDLTQYYDKFPLRIKDEVFATTLEGSSEVKATPAKRLIHTSNLTGINKVVCPKNIDLDNLILTGRQRMHNQDKSPWAFHDFWLRDMDFANGKDASIVIAGNSDGKCEYAFFPGCQLGASLPETVDKTYEYLLGKNENTGLILRCCGAPAEWSGNNDKHEDTLSEFKKQWEELGMPKLITACPTCSSQIGKHLPEIDVVSIYEYLDSFADENNDFDNDNIQKTFGQKEVAVFDPCSTREDEEIKKAVRNICGNLGLSESILPDQSYIPRCCSFGGQPSIANPEYTDYVVENRINEKDVPYITYCVNCRDVFLKAGKETKHILELMFDSEQAASNEPLQTTLPTVSERRDNRIYLKKTMLKKYWSEEMDDTREEYKFKLIIPDNILAEMDKERILQEEVYNVVDFMLRTNRKVIDPDTGIHSGYRQIGYMTYWVSFRETNEENTYEIVDAYNHRMEIELEAVWNGIKQEVDM